MKKKILVVGPWLGEFGWLLMRWQGHIRHLSREYDRTIVFHADNLIDRFYLFEYAENLKIGFEYHGKVDRWDSEVNPKSIILPGYLDLDLGVSEIHYINPSEEICKRKSLKQNFKKYRWGLRSKCIIIIHARNVMQSPYGPNRNWPLTKWEELVKKLKSESQFRIESIGSKIGSFHVPGTIDFRGKDLKSLTNLMGVSSVLVGPSSGPHHLAALCGLPSIIWTGTEQWDLGYGVGTNMERYKTGWNPFNTPCEIIEDWQPSVEEVYRTVIKQLEGE